MSDADAAHVISGIVIVAVIAALAVLGRKDKIATETVDLPNTEPPRKVTAGTVLSDAEAGSLSRGQWREQKRSWLGAIIVGIDNRSSTSKTIAFAWTLAVAWGLLSLIVAVWFGDHRPWDKQVDLGLQEEYLLLLGGPFAAAVLAKYAVSSEGDAKTTAPVGEAKPSELVNNDEGRTDLGDFQYVLFNVIALAFFLGDFVGDLDEGFPVLPAVLTGLALTSVAGYSAKKLLAQAAPTLTSVVPAAAPPTETIHVYGSNLSVPAGASGNGQNVSPTILVGPKTATLTADDVQYGNDHLVVTVPPNAEPGSAPISAVRGDGVAARAAGGLNALPFRVLPGPPTP
jgi:hypothetical protein